MTEKIIIAGSGGQGIMLLGKVLAEAAMREGKFLTWLPAYGAEVRGGTAYCMVTVSSRPIGTPYIPRADALIIMNQPSLKKFIPRLNTGGLMIINSSLVGGVAKKRTNSILRRPFSETASELGNLKVANMVALGCYLGKKKTVGIDTVIRVIREIAPPAKKGLVKINQEAVRSGERLCRE